MIDLLPLASVDPAAVEALLDRAFGTNRHLRTAYKVRGTARAIEDLSFSAVAGGELLGSIQCWPVSLNEETAVHPLVMVGPVAVAPERQRDGIGRRLMERALAAADAAGPAVTGEGLMLIGDPEYYGRFFGFTADRTALWRLPGSVERHRLLARGAHVPDLAGALGPAVPVPA